MNPLNGLLLSLALVSYFLGDLRAAIVIAVMVVLAIGTAFIQEHRSNNTAEKLRAMVKHIASVKRRGAARQQTRKQAASKGSRRSRAKRSSLATLSICAPAT